jgi:hypothetical protein
MQNGPLRSATRFNSLLQASDDPCPDLDLHALLLQIDLLLEELVTPGTNQRFISVVALNELTLEMRTAFGLADVRAPATYLPALSKEMASLQMARDIASAVSGPLDTIFAECDFARDTFDPNSPKFTLLRELMFRLNSVIGKFAHGRANRKILTAIERLIALSSSIFSCMASAGFQSLSKPEQIK